MPIRRTPSSAGQLTGNVTTPVSPAPMTLATAPSPSTVHAPSAPASGPAVRRIHRSPGKRRRTAVDGRPQDDDPGPIAGRRRAARGAPQAPRGWRPAPSPRPPPRPRRRRGGTRRSKATPSTCSSVPTAGRRTTCLMSGESRSTGAGAEVWNDGAARAGRLPSSSGGGADDEPGVLRGGWRRAGARTRRASTSPHEATLVTGSTARSTTGELGSPSPNGAHVVPPSGERNTPASVPT